MGLLVPHLARRIFGQTGVMLPASILLGQVSTSLYDIRPHHFGWEIPLGILTSPGALDHGADDGAQSSGETMTVLSWNLKMSFSATRVHRAGAGQLFAGHPPGRSLLFLGRRQRQNHLDAPASERTAVAGCCRLEAGTFTPLIRAFELGRWIGPGSPERTPALRLHTARVHCPGQGAVP